MTPARNIAGCGAVFSVLAFGVAPADPPTAYESLHLPDAPAVQRPSPLFYALAAGDLPIRLERTPLTKVREIYGGDIHHGGDAGGGVTWVCYARADPGGGSLIYWFLSNNEMGGGAIITQVAAQHTASAPDPRCASAPPRLNRIRFGVPEIASSLDAVRRRFGENTPVGGYLIYANSHPARGAKAAGFTTDQTVSYHFTNGVADTVSVTQVTSN